jgi:hypothetical protein
MSASAPVLPLLPVQCEGNRRSAHVALTRAVPCSLALNKKAKATGLRSSIHDPIGPHRAGPIC